MKLPVAQTAVPLWQTPVALVSLVLTVFVLLYSSSILSLIDFWWNSDNYSHGILVPLISFYLIWLKREALADAGATPLPWGGGLILVLSFGWLGAKIINIQLIEQVALIALFPALAWSLLGHNTTKIILFPLAYLFLAAPIWDFITTPLQNLTAIASFKILQLTGMPILLEEYYISIPAGNFKIAAACGGLRFFIAAAAISTLYAYLNLRSLFRQVIFVTIALLGAVVLNWIRVCIIIWIGHVTNMEHSLVNDHNSLGWWLFAGAMFPLFHFGSKISEPEMTSAFPSTKTTRPMKKDTLFIFTFIPIFALIVAPLSFYLAENFNQQSENRHISSPAIPSPWTAVSLPSRSDWKPVFKGADSQITDSYRMQNGIVYLHISHYSKQTQGAELINELNTLYDGSIWKKADENERELQLENGETLQIKEIWLQKKSNQRTRLIWYWYRVANRNTVNPMTAKLLELWKLTGSSSGAAVVALAIDYDGSPEAARDQLKHFSLDAYLAIEASL